jgi:hypothetical protein
MGNFELSIFDRSKRLTMTKINLLFYLQKDNTIKNTDCFGLETPITFPEVVPIIIVARVMRQLGCVREYPI